MNNKNPDNTSLFSLNTVDLVAIVMTPDFNDLKTKEQTEKIVQKLSDYWASNPAEAEKRAAELLEKEDTIKLRIMEKALREDVDPSVALKTMNELLLDKIIAKGTVSAKLVAFTETDIVNGLNNLNISTLVRPRLYKSTDGKPDYGTNIIYPLTINAVGGSKIALYELLSLTVYDIDSNTKANTTIGFGHLLHEGAIKAKEVGMKITLADATQHLLDDLIANDKVVSQKIENKGLTGTLNRNQYFALFDLQYNAGAYVDDVLTALKISPEKGIEKLYQNILDFPRGEQIRRYFEYISFTENRYVSPEEAKEEMIKKGIYKFETK